MVPLIQHDNRIIKVGQFNIVENALAETYLTADIASGVSVLTVKDIGDFAVGKYVWLDPFGPNSEIIAVHAATAPSGSTVTLAANTVFAHSSGEKVYYVEFNQVEISHSVTLTGAKSVLATEALTAREREHVYLDTSQTSGYYFARFNDSIASTFSGYSDGVVYDGWATDSVGHMIERSMRDLSVEFSEDVTLEDCIDWLGEGMREIQGKQRRWPEHYSYNEIIGQTVRGINLIAMPSGAYDRETNRSILTVRLGDGDALAYLDPNSFDTQMGDVKITQVRTAASVSDITLELDNSYDFDDSGIVNVYIAGIKYSISYTGVTRDDADGGTAVLTGVPASGDGSITVTIPVDTNVWQDESEGVPHWYTVRNSNLEYWPLPDQNQDNENIYLDYSKVAVVVNSQIDTIDYQRYGMLQMYLTWRIHAVAKNSGKLDQASAWYTTYKERLNDAIRTNPVIKTKTGPNINRMMKRGGRFRTKPNVQNLSISDQ